MGEKMTNEGFNNPSNLERVVRQERTRSNRLKLPQKI